MWALDQDDADDHDEDKDGEEGGVAVSHWRSSTIKVEIGDRWGTARARGAQWQMLLDASAIGAWFVLDRRLWKFQVQTDKPNPEICLVVPISQWVPLRRLNGVAIP